MTSRNIIFIENMKYLCNLYKNNINERNQNKMRKAIQTIVWCDWIFDMEQPIKICKYNKCNNFIYST